MFLKVIFSLMDIQMKENVHCASLQGTAIVSELLLQVLYGKIHTTTNDVMLHRV